MSEIHSIPSDDEPQALALHRVISSGLPLATGLRAYAEECPSAARSSLLQLASSVEAGQSIEAAIQNPDLHLPGYLRGLVDGGVRTGMLGPMLEEYLHQRRLQKRFGQKVALDLAYPLVVVYVSLLGTFLILTQLVPTFESIYDSMFDTFQIDLPIITRGVIELSNVAVFCSIPLSMGFVVLGAALLIFIFGGRWSKALIDRIPFFGTSARYASMAEFCSLLAPLVKTSVPLPEALKAVASTMQPSRLKSSSRKLASSYDGSRDLTEDARHCGFPREIVHLMHWENRGWAFSEILKSWAELFAQMASGRSTVISAIAGPILMIGLGVLIVLLVVAMFAPLLRFLNALS